MTKVAGAGGFLAVTIAALIGIGAASAGEERPTRVRLTLAEGGDDVVPVLVEVLTPAGEVVRSLPARAPGVIELAPALERGLRVAARADDLWNVPAEVDPDQAELVVTLWPAGELHAHIVAPEGSPIPAAMSVRLESSSDAREPRLDRITLLCPVDEAGKLVCSLPRLRPVDLRLRAPGFASRFFREVDLRQARVFDLGRVELTSGASVVGSLTVPGGFDVRDVDLSLEPARRSPQPGEESKDRLRARPDARGWFAFEGLNAGLYRISASHPELAPFVVEPVRVVEGAQTELEEEIAMTAAEPVRLVIDPLFDPWQADWSVRIFRRPGPGYREDHPIAEVGAMAGIVETAPLAPGSLVVELFDSRGNLLASQNLDHSRDGGFQPFVVTAVRVAGSVSLGDDPLLARLLWRGAEARVTMESDLDGRFEGVLPHGGEWDVEVTAIVPPVRWRRRDVSIVAEGGAATLDLRLPDTRLEGVVVDEEGRPWPRAQVSVDQPLTGREVSGESDGDGRFVFYGLTLGEYQVVASAGDTLGSVPERVEVREGSTPRQRLVLRPRAKLSGRVVDASGNPLPGVWVQGEPFLAGGVLDAMNAGAATTDASGRFRLDLAPGTASIHVAILAPGFALRQVLLEPGDGGDLRLTTDGGNLLVEVPPDVAWTDPAQPRPFLIDGEGNALPLGPLVGWSNLNGVEVDVGSGLVPIPLVEPGAYRVCWLTAEELRFRGAAGRGCDAGLLHAGGDLRLRLGPAAD